MSEEQEAEPADDTEDVAAESEGAEGADTDTEDAEDGLQEGDFVRLAYTARTVEDGDLVDTTDEEVAEEADVDTDEQTFEPRTIVLGANQIFATVEEDVIGKEVGDSGNVVIPAEEAFGEYDDEEVRTVSADRIPEEERYPGAHVDLDGEHGHVQTIIGGRARVDFNHPLAGEDVEYEYEIVGEIDDRLEKAQGMLSTYFDVELDMHLQTDEVEEEEAAAESDEDGDEGSETETETVEKETLYIESNPQLQFNQQWMMGKQQIAQDLIDRLDIDRVVIQEIIDGQSAGMMGGMGGMMGGAGGEDLGDIEDAIEDADVDADEIVEELETGESDETTEE